MRVFQNIWIGESAIDDNNILSTESPICFRPIPMMRVFIELGQG